MARAVALGYGERMLLRLCRARGARAAVWLAFATAQALLHGCNAFDDPPDGVPAISHDPRSDGARPPISQPRTPPATMTAPSPGPGMEELTCLGHPGVERLSVECARCACATDPRLVLTCDATCFDLFACVVDACGGSRDDLTCIVSECADLIASAASATQLDGLLMGECGAVCAGQPAPALGRCAPSFVLELDDQDGGAECELTLPVERLPADFSVSGTNLVIEAPEGRRALALLDDPSQCEDGTEGYAYLDDSSDGSGPSVALCPAACEAGSVEVSFLCVQLPL
jgi:hypothetical protein